MIDSNAINFELRKVVGGPGFEPGASRSRTVTLSADRFESGLLASAWGVAARGIPPA
jgi:hypothetical protein